jgi:flagellar basal body-associated protein FliL
MANVTQRGWHGFKVAARQLVSFLLGLAMFAAVGSLGCKKSSVTNDELGDDGRAQRIRRVVRLESFVVNVADPEGGRFLRVGIDLGLENQLSTNEGRGGAGDLPIAHIRDCILSVLSTWRSDALLAPEGKEKLKNELLRALRDRVPELGVKEVYFTDFLVQF